MYCGGCAKAIEGTVAKLPDVASCEASYEDGAATVVASDPAAATAIIEAIVGLGYQARLAGAVVAGVGLYLTLENAEGLVFGLLSWST